MTERFEERAIKLVTAIQSDLPTRVVKEIPPAVFQDWMLNVAAALREVDQAAREEEREACAKVADSHDKNCGACGCDSWQIAQSIRARSAEKEGGE